MRWTRLDFVHDKDALHRKEELSAMSIACEAVIILGRRYEALAREMAAAETDPQWKADLLAIAENCGRVPAHKPQTFHQALQMYWFVHLAVTSELNPWDSYSPGRLDQHVYPFYRDDVAAGRLTRDQGAGAARVPLVKFNNQPAPPKVGVTLKESGTYTDLRTSNTGASRRTAPTASTT